MHVSLRLDKRNILKFKIFLQRFSFKSYPRKQYCCLRSLTWPQRSTVGLRFFKCIPSALSRHEHHARFFRKALAQLGTQPSGFQPTLPPPPPPGALDAGKSRSRGRFKFHVNGYSFAFSCRKLTQPRESFGRQRKMIEQSYPPSPIRKCWMAHRMNILHV